MGYGIIRYFILLAFAILFSINSSSQQRTYPFIQLYQLDSLGHSTNLTRHFGYLYYEFLKLVEAKLDKADTSTQRFIRNFEQVFAQFYIDACYAFAKKQEIPMPAWRAYFTDTSFARGQYFLLGANAHLNGQLAEAIAHSYTAEEWPSIKKKYYLFNSCLNETYDLVYKEALTSSRRVKLLHILTLGLDKPLGNYYLYKWRKRQMRLTEYFYADKEKYNRLLNKINRKKIKIDRMIMTQL
jgi:hypothetical protein